MWSRGGVARESTSLTGSLPFLPDPERWTNIPLLVKILKLVINELSNVMEANAARQAAPAEWGQGAQPDSQHPERLSVDRVGCPLLTCSGRPAGRTESCSRVCP